MSQRGVEALLGRLVTDREFRRRFWAQPAEACAAEALELTARELEAVSMLEESHIDEFAGRLDAKIVRAEVSQPARRRGHEVARPARTSAATGGRK